MINNYFSKNPYEQFLNNQKKYKKNQFGSIAPWLFIFLSITVVVALFICALTTLVVMLKTKTKINELKEKQKEEIIQSKNNEKEVQIVNEQESRLEFDKKEIKTSFKKLLENLQLEAKRKELLKFELIDIKEIKIEIINYMKNNNIKTIDDLVVSEKENLNKLISNFPTSNFEKLEIKEEKFIHFLNQIENFIKTKKRK